MMILRSRTILRIYFYGPEGRHAVFTFLDITTSAAYFLFFWDTAEVQKKRKKLHNRPIILKSNEENYWFYHENVAFFSLWAVYIVSLLLDMS